jgi:sterol desaturase/sphingolipid hydroxylase (fatty acid hydroxylase superfamily)
LAHLRHGAGNTQEVTTFRISSRDAATFAAAWSTYALLFLADDLAYYWFHRIHYLDRNYGGILIVWDRIFGTFQGETERPRYGLTRNIRTFRPTRVAFHEFADLARDVRAATGWRERLGYVFRGPGWSPDGTGGGTRG